MSTKCIVVIDDWIKKKTLYRHHDGYLSLAGLELFKKIVEARDGELYIIWKDWSFALPSVNIDEVVASLPRYYEYTENIHGDIDFIYKITYGRYGIMLLYSEYVNDKIARKHLNASLLRGLLKSIIDAHEDEYPQSTFDDMRKDIDWLSKVNPNI